MPLRVSFHYIHWLEWESWGWREGSSLSSRVKGREGSSLSSRIKGREGSSLSSRIKGREGGGLSSRVKGIVRTLERAVIDPGWLEILYKEILFTNGQGHCRFDIGSWKGAREAGTCTAGSNGQGCYISCRYNQQAEAWSADWQRAVDSGNTGRDSRSTARREQEVSFHDTSDIGVSSGPRQDWRSLIFDGETKKARLTTGDRRIREGVSRRSGTAVPQEGRA